MAKASNQQDSLTKPKGTFRSITDTHSGPPASSFHKRLWSLQNLAGGGQQWRKVGPLPSSIKTGKEADVNVSSSKEKSPAFDKQLPFLSVPPSQTEDRLLDQENQHAEFENRDPDHASLDEGSLDDPEHKRGLRRKAAKGLKRIMTHFSLSDVSSLPDHCQSPSALHDEDKVESHQTASSSGTNDHRHLQRSVSHQPTSSTNIDLAPMAHPTHPTALRSKIIELLPTHTHDYQRHHYRSQSQPSEPLTTVDLASLADRTLPPLPSSPATTTQHRKPSRHLSNAMEEYLYFKTRMNEAHVEQKLRQAVHWLGRPFHRFLSTPLLSTMANQESPISPLMIHRPALMSPASRCSSTSSLAANATTAAMLLAHRGSYGSMHEEPDPWVQETSQANGKMLDLNFRFTRKKVLRCRVVQITNIASAKEYQYELFVQLNDMTQASQMGTMKKIAKGISAASPKESFSFEVDSPFTLTFTLCAKPVNGGFSKMKTLISKMDLSHQQEEPTPEDQYTSTMPVVGSTCLLSGNRFEAFSGKGLSRYTLTKPLSDKNQKELQDMDFELMVAFQLEDAVSPSHTYMSGLWTGELDFEAALAVCHQGDYLTFYVRSKQFPVSGISKNEHYPLILF
ncbi:hypothetical protein [Absidia glauca]|uniref:Uncharacterized protein n=1 Tax=Absidia glauca TaxID=4829 RepID=A0A168T7I8_ABSGL|nr:hypothetical protein [Absidia glauca]